MLQRAVPLLALILLCAAHAPAQERESIQDLLRRLRQQTELVLAALSGEVDALVAELEGRAVARDLPAMESARARLVRLGTAAAPLLVERIDPGTSPTDAQILRAQYVALALGELCSPAVTDRLVELAQSASPLGRANALRALARAPDPERAAPVVIGIARGGPKELKAQAFTALARMECDSARAALREALTGGDPESVRHALEGLAQAGNPRHADEVLRVTSSPSVAFAALDALLSWYRAVPEAPDAAHVAALAELAAAAQGPAPARARVLELLPALSDRFDAGVKKTLRALAESPARELREGALIALVLSGDKGARRDLLAGYDQRIEQNREFAAAYEERAEVLYRIGEYRDSERDWRQAIKLAAQDLRARQDVAWVGLARCLARQNKLKDAAQALERAPLTQKQLTALRADPAFEKLAQHARYGQVFGTD